MMHEWKEEGSKGNEEMIVGDKNGSGEERRGDTIRGREMGENK